MTKGFMSAKDLQTRFDRYAKTGRGDFTAFHVGVTDDDRIMPYMYLADNIQAITSSEDAEEVGDIKQKITSVTAREAMQLFDGNYNKAIVEIAAMKDRTAVFGVLSMTS